MHDTRRELLPGELEALAQAPWGSDPWADGRLLDAPPDDPDDPEDDLPGDDDEDEFCPRSHAS